MSNDPREPDADTPAVDENASEAELRKASEQLKTKIEEAKRRNDMPLDSALGNPNWENDAADGRFDRPESEDDE
jgi:hypothetical protein